MIRVAPCRCSDVDPAEHVRFHGYIRALSEVPDSSEHGLLMQILEDPDRAMAESVVIGHLDRRALALNNDDVAFTAWCHRIADALRGHELAERRLREWMLLHEIDSGRPWDTADLVQASDWLQRRLAELAELADSEQALTTLAIHGRTSRIRNAARSRLDHRPT